VLELWLGRRGGLTDRRLCQIMASPKAWPNLRELSLLNPDGEKARFRKGLVTTANKAAGRKVATYRDGYPELFPFAEDFWDVFPGYLPDGRVAMAAEDHHTDPPTLCVLTFDERGEQTEDVLRVPMPADLLAIPVNDWYQHKDRMKQHLIDVLGFWPGFIRIRDCRFPGDEHRYNRPYWRRHEDLGYPDDGRNEEYLAFPELGHGGLIWRDVRDAEWIFGWDRCADKRGWIHST